MPAPTAALNTRFREQWTRKHLLGLEELSAEEITLILDQAAEFKRLAQQGEVKLKALEGTVVGNLFFEPSTRTRTSFSLAAKRLSADTIDFTSSGSSLSKGETFLDTARNIEAMGVSQVVVRHRTPGAPHLLAKQLKANVLNAGDGTHEHPTQGLLDIFTIREHRGSLQGLTVTLVGDILHSRVARSNIWGLTKLGAGSSSVDLPRSFRPRLANWAWKSRTTSTPWSPNPIASTSCGYNLNASAGRFFRPSVNTPICSG